jgi:hypothetical protein
MTRAKLGEIKVLLQKLLSESEKFITPEPEAFGRHLKAFLVEGDALLKDLAGKGYNWRTWGTEEDRGFLTFMNKQRADEVHRGGSAKVVKVESVPIGKVPTHLARGFDFSFSMPLGTGQPTLGRRICFFQVPGGEDKNVVDCCKRYFSLLERLVDEFGG